MTHKEWLDNEYAQWVKALQESTVHNFKEHPVVKRMLSLDSEFDGFAHFTHLVLLDKHSHLWNTLRIIKHIGGKTAQDFWFFRMLHYAHEIIKLNPPSICEIGGGVGQFMAILTALGYKGEHFIFDLPEVQEFQRKYLDEVRRQTGLNTFLMRSDKRKWDFICSFYALGEFDDQTKESYRDIIDQSKHGYIAWNPHSDASDDLSIFNKHNFTVTPGIEPGIKIIQW